MLWKPENLRGTAGKASGNLRSGLKMAFQVEHRSGSGSFPRVRPTPLPPVSGFWVKFGLPAHFSVSGPAPRQALGDAPGDGGHQDGSQRLKLPGEGQPQGRGSFMEVHQKKNKAKMWKKSWKKSRKKTTAGEPSPRSAAPHRGVAAKRLAWLCPLDHGSFH